MPIFDQGYQHWKGHLSGHGWRWLAIARHGVRIGLQGRVFRIVLLVSLLPALVLATVLSIWSLIERKSDLVGPIVQFLSSMQILSPTVAADPRQYRLEVWTLCYNYFFSTELTLSMILIVLVGPNLISQDLRFNALPLYLSRPLRRIDYLGGKLGVIGAFLGLAIIVPCLVTYALGLLFSLDVTIVRDTYRLLLASVAYGLVIIVCSGMLILALSSLSRNSRYVALFWVSIWIVGGLASTILEGVYYGQVAASQMSRPPEMPRGRDARRRMTPADLEKQQNWAEDFQTRMAEASKTDWRPLISYTSNLSRIGRELLGTDAAWRKLSELQPAQMRGRVVASNAGPLYPWYWSAGVLAGLFVISVCVLSLSVRSLDRLR
ncbi:MAG TPA: ABC transporter permease subunit [Planctomycetaceae bacterium]|jgi:ABC-2 type transport system permease protein|nr:ABC transporter permease subunit [Planctomycetaceae bacterium]